MTDAQRRKPMTSRPEILAKRITPTLLLLALGGALLVVTARPAGANGCKPDGQRCQTNISCCSRNCMKPASPPGKAKPLFGTCCTPTTCTKQGATCGMIPDGDCGDTLNCGTCPAGQSCGTDNVCHCAPNCANKICGDDGCGGSCGTCDMSECDTTTGMCVPCIPDGDQGCRGDFDCCSGVCGAGTVCETSTTTTTTTSTTTTQCTPISPCNDLTCGPVLDNCGDTVACPCTQCTFQCAGDAQGPVNFGRCDTPTVCADACGSACELICRDIGTVCSTHQCVGCTP